MILNPIEAILTHIFPFLANGAERKAAGLGIPKRKHSRDDPL